MQEPNKKDLDAVQIVYVEAGFPKVHVVRGRAGAYLLQPKDPVKQLLFPREGVIAEALGIVIDGDPRTNSYWGQNNRNKHSKDVQDPFYDDNFDKAMEQKKEKEGDRRVLSMLRNDALADRLCDHYTHAQISLFIIHFHQVQREFFEMGITAPDQINLESQRRSNEDIKAIGDAADHYRSEPQQGPKPAR